MGTVGFPAAGLGRVCPGVLGGLLVLSRWSVGGVSVVLWHVSVVSQWCFAGVAAMPMVCLHSFGVPEALLSGFYAGLDLEFQRCRIVCEDFNK